MVFGILVFLATMGAYALNTWKIRKIARDRLLASVILEGGQATAFLLVVARIAAGPSARTVVVAYVFGAMLGTTVAMWKAKDARRGAAESVCPWCGGRTDRVEHLIMLLENGELRVRIPEAGHGRSHPAGERLAQPLHTG